MEADAKPVSCPMAIQEIEKYPRLVHDPIMTAVRETGGQQDNVTIIEKAFGYRSPHCHYRPGCRAEVQIQPGLSGIEAEDFDVSLLRVTSIPYRTYQTYWWEAIKS